MDAADSSDVEERSGSKRRREDEPVQLSTAEDFQPFVVDEPGAATDGGSSSPQPATREVAATTPPWLLLDGDDPPPKTKNVLVRLHNEILAFCDLLALSDEEKRDRERAIDDLRAETVALWPDATLSVFGSQLTGLRLPTSDVDVAVFGAADKGSRALHRLGDALRRGVARDVEVVDSARIPIVKFEHAATGVAVDVSFGVDSGMRTARRVNDLMAAHPTLRPLILVVKYVLAERDLNQTYHGGLGSFATQMLVASFVQHRHRADCATGLRAPQNLGSLLLEFFELYGKKWNYHVVGLSVRNGGSYFHKRARGWFDNARPSLLAIENPEDPSMDVGKNSYMSLRIKTVFEHCFNSLIAALHDESRASALSAIVDPTSPLLQGRRRRPPLGASSSASSSASSAGSAPSS